MWRFKSRLRVIRLEGRNLPTVSVPLLNSWLNGNTAEYATVISALSGGGTSGPSTTWTGQTTAVLGDVLKVSAATTPSSGYVYINTPDLASYTMGPWWNDASHTTPFVNFPKNQNAIYRVALNTTYPQSSHGNTPGGPVGVAVNGVVFFNSGDAFSYKHSSATDIAMTGDNIWNRQAGAVETVTYDHGHGHQPGNGAYHYHENPPALRAQLGDNIDYVGTTNYFPYDPGVLATQGQGADGTYTEHTTNLHHSPIIGWMFDGYPVYGPYGYSNPLDSTSAIKRMESSFSLRTGMTTRVSVPGWSAQLDAGTLGATAAATAADGFYTMTAAQQSSYAGPPVNATYPLGRYGEDYAYVTGLGDLDQFNGRFTKTPEYPNGTYAYFITIDATGEEQFPYLINRQYYGTNNGSGTVTSITEAVSVKFDVTATVTTPTDSNATTNQVADYSANGTLVGITANSTTTQGTMAYSLIDNAGGRFAINSSTGVITVANGSMLNHLTASSHTITVGANNGIGPTATKTFTINVLADTTLPIAVIISQPASITNSISATFDFTGSDPLSGGVSSGLNHMEYKLDGGSFATATSPLTLNSLADGLHTFHYRAVDNAGNISSAASYSWTIDTTAPMATFSAPSMSATASGPVTYTLTISDANFDPTTLTLADFTLNATGSATGTLGLSGSGNLYTLTIYAISGTGSLGVTLAAAAIADLASNSNASPVIATPFNVAPVPPPIVTGVVFGDGTSQRSTVKQIVVTFSESVAFMPNVASAFTVNRTGTGGTLGNVDLTANPSTGSASSVTISFSGSLTESGGSLVDGFYTIMIDAAQVTGTGGALDGNGDLFPGGSYSSVGTTANKQYRLFGDSDGNGTVNQVDYNAFRLVYLGGPNSEFDFNNDGTVNQLDYDSFRFRYLGTP